MGHCKNCKYAEEDDRIFTPQNWLFGVALFGFPIGNCKHGELICSNIDSIFYDDPVDKHDSCIDFKKKNEDDDDFDEDDDLDEDDEW